MREMNDSGVEWIGEIPCSWRTAEIKFYCKDVYAGGTPQSTTPEYWDGDIPWIPSGSCHDCKIYTAPKTITEEGFNNSSTKKIPANTALVAMTGATCGNTGFLTFESCANQSVTAYVAKENAYSLYIWYLLQAARDNLLTYQTGGAQGGVNVENCKNIIVPFVQYEEQKRIADYLDAKCDKIDSIIEKQQAIIEKLKEYKLSVITEAVTKGLNSDVEMKDSGVRFVKEIPANWENRKMITILSTRVVDGPHESPELYDSGVPYISATAIVNGKIDFSLMRGYISEEYCDLCDKRYIPQKGDLLVVKLGASTGQVAIVDTDERFNIWVPLAAVRCNDEALPKFVYYAFQSDYFIRQMELSWTFGTQQTLGVQTIEKLRILLPPINEQQTIVDFLDDEYERINSKIEKTQELIEKLEEYKKSLIYEGVTGKKEV